MFLCQIEGLKLGLKFWYLCLKIAYCNRQSEQFLRYNEIHETIGKKHVFEYFYDFKILILTVYCDRGLLEYDLWWAYILN